jgi:hypothetical protein
VLALRRRGFSTTCTPITGSVHFQPAPAPTIQGTTSTGPDPVARLPFSEGFEAGTAGNWDVNVGMTFTTAQRYVGSWSSQITAPGGGTPNDNYLEFNFGDASTVGGQAVGQRDLWVRFAHKWSSNWADNGYASVQKLMLLNIHNPVSGRRRYQMTFNLWTPDLGYFFEFLRINEDGTFAGSATPNVGLGVTRQLGIWTEFVFRVRMNTPGSSDGILQAWTKNEGESGYTQRVDRSNINFRDGTSFSPNRIIQSNYQPDGTPSGQRWWDYWLVSEEAMDVTPPPTIIAEWPEHSPAYVTLLPGTGGYGLNTPAGAGRGTGTTVIFIDSLSDQNSGTAINASLSAALNWPTPSFIGTPEYAARHAASPKVVVPITSGMATIQDSIPMQTGTPPRPGFITWYGQAAPEPGLYLRGCNLALNGASDVAIWHLRSLMGDDVTGLPAGNRDCLSSGYGGGLTSKIVLLNCEFQWSVDELVDFYRRHSEISFVSCAFVEPLHDSTIDHPEDPPATDHGFGPIIGGDTGGQPSAVSTFRCLWAHTTGRNPLTNATTFVHANNLHYNHGRPAGGAGNAVQIHSSNATDPMSANILGNAFIRGPNNNTSLVACSVSTTLPPGSSGYSFGNAQFGWTTLSNQNAFFTSSPTGYAVSARVDAAYPGSWGASLNGVLQWAANPLAPTAAEWTGFVEKMKRTVGAQPRWRTSSNSRLPVIFDQIRDRLNGVAQTNQFVDTVAQAGGWPTIPVNVINPLAPGSHWHAPIPTGPDRDTAYTSGTFSDGRSRVGYTRLEAWGYEQHLYVMEEPAEPTSQFTPTRWVSSTATGSGNGLSASTPWTLAQAIASASPGDRILLMPGVYNGPLTGAPRTASFTLSRPGTASEPIIWFAQNYAALSSSNRTQLTNSGVFGTNSCPVFGITASAVHNHVYGLYIFEPQANPGYDTGSFYISTAAASGVKVRYCHMDRNSVSNWAVPVDTGSNTCGMFIEPGVGIEISDNKFSNYTTTTSVSYGKAPILIFSSTLTPFSQDMVFRNNTIENCNLFIYIKGAGFARPVRGNVQVFRNRAQLTQTSEQHNYLVNFSDCGNDAGPNLVYQNLVIGGHMLARGHVQTGGYITKSLICANNTCINMRPSDADGVLYTHFAVATTIPATHRFHNNIHYNATPGGVRLYSMGYDTPNDNSWLSCDHNTAYNSLATAVNSGTWCEIIDGIGAQTLQAYRTRTGRDQNSSIRDPLLASATYGNPQFGKLQVGSLERNAGVDILNLLGNGTAGAINRGCFITSDMSDVIGIRPLT